MIIMIGIVLVLVTLCVVGLFIVLDICVQKIQELNREVHKLKRVEKDIVDLGIKVSGISSRVDICEKNHMTAEDEYVKNMENVGRELIRVNNYMAKIRVEERRARNMSVFEGAKENKELINDIYGEVAYKIHKEMKENEENEAEN